MEKWEYLTKFVYADITNPGVSQFMRKNWPDWNPAMYTPEAMMPELNELGADGWEVVHMEPVQQIGTNGDVGFYGGSANTWSHGYFCVLKRRLSE